MAFDSFATRTTSFSIHNIYNVEMASARLLAHFPLLRQLHLRLPTLVWSGEDPNLPHAVSLIETLEYLSLEWRAHRDGVARYQLASTWASTDWSKLKSLRSVRLESSWLDTNAQAFIKRLAEHVSRLHSLEFDLSKATPKRDWRPNPLTAFPSLEHLAFSGSTSAALSLLPLFESFPFLTVRLALTPSIVDRESTLHRPRRPFRSPNLPRSRRRNDPPPVSLSHLVSRIKSCRSGGKERKPAREDLRRGGEGPSVCGRAHAEGAQGRGCEGRGIARGIGGGVQGCDAVGGGLSEGGRDALGLIG